MTTIHRYEKHMQEEREHCLNCERPAEYCNGECEYIVEHGTITWCCAVKDMTTGKIYPSMGDEGVDLRFGPYTIYKKTRTGS